jgi:hypothetical protein
MEAAGSFETFLTINQTRRRHKSKDYNFHDHLRENTKSYKFCNVLTVIDYYNFNDAISATGDV